MDFSKKSKFVQELVKSTIANVILHPVTFDLIYKYIPAFDSVDYQDDDKFMEEFESFTKDMDWDTVLFPELNSIDIKSLSKGYGDFYKVDDCHGFFSRKGLFKYSMDCPNGVTVRSLTECIYRMKSSKYEFWYEMLSDVKLDISGTTLKVVVDFDYGS